VDQDPSDSQGPDSDSPVCRVADGGYVIEIGQSAGMVVSGEAPQRSAAGVTEPEKAGGRVAEDAVDRAAGVTAKVEQADLLYKDLADGSLEVAQVQSSVDSLLALLGRLDKEGRYEDALRVARTLSKLLALARRWAALIESLLKAERAGELIGKPAAVAWAKHELGTARLIRGDLKGADRDLGDARRMREEIGDSRGLAATTRNLQALCRQLRQMMQKDELVQRRGLFRPAVLSPIVLAAVALLLLGAGGVAGAILKGNSSSSAKEGGGQGPTDTGGGPKHGGGGHPKEERPGGERPGGEGNGTRSLTVSLAGKGSGTIRSDPAGIDCPETCAAAFADERAVTLSAEADEGSIFAGFSDNCTGGDTCIVAMTEAQTVTAGFEPATVELSIAIAGTGTGSITSVPQGIDCRNGPEGASGACSAPFQAGEEVELAAKTTGEFSEFGGFSGELTGDCGESTCTVTMDRDRVVETEFRGPPRERTE